MSLGKRDLKSVRQAGTDKFYTLPEYAKEYISNIDLSIYDLIVEPSAGSGSFYNNIYTKCDKIGIDIEPEHPDIIKMNFFDYISDSKYTRILVIGNPPFGKSCSLAVKFFNHAAKWCDTIAFIIPRTFRKTSIINKLDKHFHLYSDIDTPTNPCIFTPKMSVKCCFQVWMRDNQERVIKNMPTTHPDWHFLGYNGLDERGQPKPPNNADFAIRAYGGKIGFIQRDNLETLRPKSWHWIKSVIDKNILIERFTALDYSGALNTARQNSMGRAELVELYTHYTRII